MIDLNELADAIGKLILRFRTKRATAAEWTAANTLLLDAEIGYETDTRLKKIGDGVTPWNSLPYDGIVELIEGSGIDIDDSDPQRPVITATGGGGGGGGSVVEQLNATLVAALAAYPTTTVSGAGDLYDLHEVATIDGIDYHILAYSRMCNSSSFTDATNAKFTVPSGKTARYFNAVFDVQTGGNWLFYKSQLYNSTTSVIEVGPASSGAVTIAANNTGAIASPITPAPYWPNVADAGVTIPLSVTLEPVVGVAGDTLIVRLAGASDGHTRGTSSAYVVAVS